MTTEQDGLHKREAMRSQRLRLIGAPIRSIGAGSASWTWFGN
jgi:hypothetical protein